MAKFLKNFDEASKWLSQRLTDLLKNDETITATVRTIITDVVTGQDSSLIKYTEKFDGWKVGNVANLRISEKEIKAAKNNCSPESLKALEMVAGRIEEYHIKQIPEDERYPDYSGNELGWQWTPIEKVGLYVPGGKAAYPSSVLMNAVPAKVAGVENIVMVVPAPKGEVNPLVLAAANIAGIKEIYKIGGAQAVAALAFGTETVTRVDKIVGPGNAYVTEAKRQVFGFVGIDTIAGPSEVLVIANDSSNPEWVAADLLSQAEHDEMARAILVTPSKKLAESVQEAVEKQLKNLKREKIASKSWKDNGAIVLVKNLDEACEIANLIAAEHTELCFEGGEKYADKIKNSGALFIGRYTPEAIGDYSAGPSHVLPTSGAARFSSGLSVYDFLKRTSIISCSEEGFEKLADATEILANEEGLGAHANSVSIRRK